MDNQGGITLARRTALGLLGSGAVALLAGRGFLSTSRYCFKMTVRVDTPNGLKQGFSVFEVKAGNAPKLLPEERSRDWTVRGEAVAIDLPGGRTLFALLKTDNPMRADLALMSMSALDPAFNNDVVESAKRIASGTYVRSPAKVPALDYPLLVTFRDVSDPKTMERVDPANLATIFGAGVKLKDIVVEVTSEPVTTGLVRRLAWLERMKTHDFRKDGPFYKSYPTELRGLKIN